jgi:hypothetical protein
MCTALVSVRDLEVLELKIMKSFSTVRLCPSLACFRVWKIIALDSVFKLHLMIPTYLFWFDFRSFMCLFIVLFFLYGSFSPQVITLVFDFIPLWNNVTPCIPIPPTLNHRRELFNLTSHFFPIKYFAFAFLNITLPFSVRLSLHVFPYSIHIYKWTSILKNWPSCCYLK